MAIVLHQSIAFDVNSDPAGGAEQLTPNNAQFEINLDVPISIPGDAKNATVSVEEATVWNTVANISVGLNNNHFYIIDNDATINVTIPDGSYGVQDLSAAINRFTSFWACADGGMRPGGGGVAVKVLAIGISWLLQEQAGD